MKMSTRRGYNVWAIRVKTNCTKKTIEGEKEKEREREREREIGKRDGEREIGKRDGERDIERDYWNII